MVSNKMMSNFERLDYPNYFKLNISINEKIIVLILAVFALVSCKQNEDIKIEHGQMGVKTDSAMSCCTKDGIFLPIS